ncbi:MAG: beta-Ala-His dipeptidase [Promethearchaeota archaeon]
MEELKQLSKLEEFWKYFEKILSIPRCSGNEAKIREFVKKEAENFGYITKIDDVGNLLIIIPQQGGNPDKKVILQCHLDMVCEKESTSSHDFSKDPIKPKIVELNGEKWLKAKGTTLGADNGVGIAYLLTLMRKIYEKKLNFENIKLNLLFTVDEESGLVGAFNLKDDFIKGNFLINLDSEEDDTFIIGCAGGINTTIEFKGTNFFTEINNLNAFKRVKFSVKGLKGGHSGVDIHRGLGNALKIISQLLWKLNKMYNINLESINGGNRPNAIPREAEAIFLVKKKELQKFEANLNKYISEIKRQFKLIEPNITIESKYVDFEGKSKILRENFKNRLISALYIIPSGPQSYDFKMKELVQSSTNLGSIRTNSDEIRIITSQRSLDDISKMIISEQIEALFQLIDSNVSISRSNEYPGWEPDWDSKLLEISKKIYKKLFNSEPYIKIIHAGLECGIIKRHFPGLDAISIGPTIINAHSPDEALKIKSIDKIWNFLVELLKNIN